MTIEIFAILESILGGGVSRKRTYHVKNKKFIYSNGKMEEFTMKMHLCTQESVILKKKVLLPR